MASEFVWKVGRAKRADLGDWRAYVGNLAPHDRRQVAGDNPTNIAARRAKRSLMRSRGAPRTSSCFDSRAGRARRAFHVNVGRVGTLPSVTRASSLIVRRVEGLTGSGRSLRENEFV
jgi:hypothetical protein